MNILAKIILVASLLMPAPALARLHSRDEQVQVPRSSLTAQQEADLKLQEAETKIEIAGKWVGLGKEVGEAFNGALSALTNQADKASKTNIGQFAMFIVAFKVLGNQLMSFLAGLIVLLVFVPLWIWSYRRTCMTRKVAIKKDGFWKKEYKIIGPCHSIYQGLEHEPAGKCVSWTKFFHYVGIAALFLTAITLIS